MSRSRNRRSSIAVLAAIVTVASALSIGTSASARQPGNIEAVPEGQDNAIFYFNQRFIPEVAQSFTLDSQTTVEALTFYPAAVTRIERTYFDVPENERHSQERFVTQYTPTATDAVLTVWKSPTTGDLGTQFDIRNGFSKVAQVDTSFTLNVGKPTTIKFASPLSLDPGTYVVVLGMRFADPHILTLHLSGRESGNNTRGGTRQQYESDCNYTRSADSYPAGRAYYGTGSIPFTGTWDNYVGYGTTFLEHQAKIQECIAIGRFDTPFNPGDLKFTLVTPSAKNPQASKPSQTNVSNAQPVSGPAPTTPPTLRKVTSKAGALAVSITPSKDTRALTNVVIAFTTPDKEGQAGRCTMRPGKRTCTIKGLASGRTYYLTAGAQWGGLDVALGPNRVNARTR